MPDLGDLREQIEEERRKIAKLSKPSGSSHLGLKEKPAIPLPDRSDNPVAGLDSVMDLGTEEPELSIPPIVVIKPVPLPQPPRPGPKTQAQMASLFAILQNSDSIKKPSTPPPISQMVVEKYGPVMEQVQDAFDRMEAWALAVKNWKLWTLFMDQYGLENVFPKPQPELAAPIPNFRSELHRLLTKNATKFPPCPLLRCKQSLFHEEHTKVIRPWLKTNFSSALMNLGDTFSMLLVSIPRGVPEDVATPPEITQFLALPNAAELVYKGIGPIFNLDISRQLSDKIRTDAMAAKRKFIDDDLLALKHRTNTYLHRLIGLQNQCTAKRHAHGSQLDRIFDLQRAIDWHNACHNAHESLNHAFQAVSW